MFPTFGYPPYMQFLYTCVIYPHNYTSNLSYISHELLGNDYFFNYRGIHERSDLLQ